MIQKYLTDMITYIIGIAGFTNLGSKMLQTPK